jgi:hypothetical protein
LELDAGAGSIHIVRLERRRRTVEGGLSGGGGGGRGGGEYWQLETQPAGSAPPNEPANSLGGRFPQMQVTDGGELDLDGGGTLRGGGVAFRPCVPGSARVVADPLASSLFGGREEFCASFDLGAKGMKLCGDSELVVQFLA